MSTVRMAYGAAASITLTVRNNNGSLTDVTGWTARAEIERFDDLSTWTSALSLSNSAVTNGGAAGTLVLSITAPQTAALASIFGSPTPTRMGRLRFFATPVGGSELQLLSADVQFLATGSPATASASDVTVGSYSVSIEAAGGIVYPDATATAHGLMSATDKPQHDNLASSVISVGIPILTGALVGAALTAAQAFNSGLLNTAATAAALKGNVGIERSALPYDIGSNQITFPPSQGVSFGGEGSSNFNPAGAYTQGGRIIYSGGGDASWDVQFTGTSASSVPIGTGLKTFAIAAALNLRPGDPVRFTATAGTTGYVDGVVYAYNPLGTSCTVSVTSVSGAGTGTAWSFTTRFDKPPIVARSHAGFAFRNITVETSNPNFRGYHIDANGTSLGSDTSKFWAHNVTFYQSGATPAAWSDIHCVGGIYMTSGFTAVVDHCKFHNMFRGAFLRGNDNYYCSSNESVHVQDASAELGGEGVFGLVHAEPAFAAAGSSFAGGGVRVTNSWAPEVAYYAGDANDVGPQIVCYGSLGVLISGNLSIKNTAVGADKYPVLLDGCHGVTYEATDDHCQGAIRMDGSQACSGIDVQLTAQTLANVFYGSNYFFTKVSAYNEPNLYAVVNGRNQISNAYLTNGAEAQLGVFFIGANGGGPASDVLNVCGVRSVLYSRGSTGAEISLRGVSRHITHSASAAANDSGSVFEGYDPDAAAAAFMNHGIVNYNGWQQCGAHTVFVTRDLGNSGTAKSIDWNRGHVQKCALTGNVTFTMTAPQGPTPTELVLELTQDTTPRTVAFSASPPVRTEGGTALTIPAGSGAKFEIRMRWTGAEYRARATGAWS